VIVAMNAANYFMRNYIPVLPVLHKLADINQQVFHDAAVFAYCQYINLQALQSNKQLKP